MSMMPTDRTTSWKRVFDRFGSLDGNLRHPSALETAGSESETDSKGRSERPNKGVLPPTEQNRRARKV